jgi:hypothetical protein
MKKVKAAEHSERVRDRIRRECNWRCANSKHIGPFAGCRCQCRGRLHGSLTLADMNDVERARAARQMRKEVTLGKVLVESRIDMSGVLQALEDALEHSRQSVRRVERNRANARIR